MKKLALAMFAAMAVISSCQVDELYNDELLCDNDKFYATISDEGSSRTVMDDDNNIRWSAGDQLIIFTKTSLGLKYQIHDSYVGKTFGYFSKVTSASGSDDFGAGMSLDHNVAYYPYLSGVGAEKRGTGYELDVVLQSEQIYAPKSFGNGSFPMAAVSSDTDLTFKNVCGGIKLQLKGICKVASIMIEGNNGEKLSGEAVVTVYEDKEKVPSIAMSEEASTSVTLNCGDGVQLNGTTLTEFIISLPPTSFTQGFTITITDTDGGTQTIKTSKQNEVVRSSLLKMPEVVVEITKDLSDDGAANCYIVSSAGSYKFTPTKGNSSESVGAIASAEVLWESFGTDVTPNVGDLVTNVKYESGAITFETPSAYKEGNAVIAAKDASGTILWSWHIWLTDQPEGQEYYNNAGTMMDRNLGATSATPGDVGASGLLYQWGRKDPFLGSSSTLSSIVAKSTVIWPTSVSSNSSSGTIEYATSHPTTFITYYSRNCDWYYTGSSSTDNTRWTTQEASKSIYDPCPPGWRVPDGGSKGIWPRALNSSVENSKWVKGGYNFSTVFGSASTIWYPASGSRSHLDGSLNLNSVCYYGYYWSASPDSYSAYGLYFYYGSTSYYYNEIYLSYDLNRASGQSVRCLQE